MKIRLHILLIIVLTFCLILPAVPVSAKTGQQDFAGTLVCSDSPGSDASFRFAGPITQIRGWGDECQTLADPGFSLIDGTLTLYSGELIIFGDGLSWRFSSKMSLKTLGGSWEGSLQGTGYVNETLTEGEVMYEVIAHGVGPYEGLQLHMFLDPFNRKMGGYIVNPGNK